MTFRFLPEARWELLDQTDWYNDQSAGLGDDFADQVERKVRDIAAQPRIYGQVQPLIRGREIRQALVPRFPFSIIYEVTTGEVIIIAVSHVRRSGRRWRRRI
jgi:plasmid stabilization system protein ParE